MNDVAVTQALAARVTAVSGPTGYAPIRKAYAFPPDAISQTPACLVMAQGDAMEYGGQTRRTTVTFAVRIYLEPVADLARRIQMMTAYRTWLRDLYNGAVTLGGLVDQASCVSTDLGADEFGGVNYLTVEARIECVQQEAVSFTA